jgi:predicted transcriptional regulator
VPEHVHSDGDLIAFTADIVASYVSNNPLGPQRFRRWSAIPTARRPVPVETLPRPKRGPNRQCRSAWSLKKDHIVCLEDGKKMKTLKRYPMTVHGLTPAEYRSRWGLPFDYPMVAEEYADQRRDLAKKIRLGHISGGQRRNSRVPESSA